MKNTKLSLTSLERWKSLSLLTVRLVAQLYITTSFSQILVISQ